MDGSLNMELGSFSAVAYCGCRLGTIAALAALVQLDLPLSRQAPSVNITRASEGGKLVDEEYGLEDIEEIEDIVELAALDFFESFLILLILYLATKEEEPPIILPSWQPPPPPTPPPLSPCLPPIPTNLSASSLVENFLYTAPENPFTCLEHCIQLL